MPEPITNPSRAMQPKRLHLVMRDNTMIEGSVHIGSEQSLLMYLGTRKGGWMNMVQAHRPRAGDTPGYVVVQVDHIIMASAPERNVQVLGVAAGAGERPVEIVLLGGAVVHGVLMMAKMQRLADYLSQSGKFIGLTRAQLAGDARDLGDVAIHASAIAMVRETSNGGTGA